MLAHTHADEAVLEGEGDVVRVLKAVGTELGERALLDMDVVKLRRSETRPVRTTFLPPAPATPALTFAQ